MAVDQRTLGEKISDTITEFGGSWKFIISFSFIMLCWVVLNTCSLFKIIRWDEYPFILLNLVLSFIAAFQAPFIMMSQNRAEAKQDEAYRQLFYEIKELVQQGNEHSRSNKEDLRTLRAEVKMLRQMQEQQRKSTNRESSSS
jgi:uncharacterized membrane protein